MPRVNIVKHVKMDGHWAIRSIPRKESGAFDWSALPEGRYLIEWYENGERRREAAGTTASEALEAQRKKGMYSRACALTEALHRSRPWRRLRPPGRFGA